MSALLKKIKNFLPFAGLAGLYFLFIITITFLFNYYHPGSAAWAQKVNPFFLLVRWDSYHYLNIATGTDTPLVFFPLYPLLIRLFSWLASPIFAGFFISFCALAVALYFLYQTIKESYGQKIAERSLVLLLIFPSSFFFALIYTESLFLALLATFFFFAQKKKWLAAALIGFFAALTRNIGIFLWPIYLLYLFLDFRYLLIKKKEAYYSLLIPLGLLLYCWYCYSVSGDFFAFISGQKAWAEWHVFMWPGATAAAFYKYYLTVPIGETGLYNFSRIVVFELGSFLLLLIAAIYWAAKRHWPYAAFSFLHVILFACMYPMTSVNRYVLVVFPIFIFLALATRRQAWLFYALLAFFAVFFIFNLHLISTGGWVG